MCGRARPLPPSCFPSASFSVGKFLLGPYLETAASSPSFGAAGAWGVVGVYYVAPIILL